MLAPLSICGLQALMGLWLTIIGAYDTQALVRSSDSVVRGHVEQISSRWNRTRTKILTEATIRIDEGWKGVAKPGSVVTVRQLGGSVDGIGMRISGTARLNRGEEVVLFLARIPKPDRGRTKPGRTFFRVVGMAQGKLSVLRRTGHPARVLFRAAGLKIVGDAPPAERLLADLRAQVQAMVKTP